MLFEIEQAKIMLKLLRKGNWDNSYDRKEHFKRFDNLSGLIKELQKKNWIILHKKPKFEAYSLNTKCKEEIINFIEENISEVKGTIR